MEVKLVITPRADTPMFGVSCWDNFVWYLELSAWVLVGWLNSRPPPPPPPPPFPRPSEKNRIGLPDYCWFRMARTAGHVSTGDSTVNASMSLQVGS